MTETLHRAYSDTVRVSVVIPSLDGDRGGNVARLLDDLGRQAYRDLEALVVVGVSPQGKAINRGVAATRGDIILIMDDDSRPGSTETIASLVAVLEEHRDVGMAGASVVQPEGCNRLQRRLAREMPRFDMPVVEEMTPSDMPCHGCCAIPRRVFHEVGGENEGLVRGLDPELRQRIRGHGYRIVLAPRTWVTHPLPASLRAVAAMFYRNGRGSAYAWRHKPELVFDTQEQAEDRGRTRQPGAGRRVLRFPCRLAARLARGHFLRALGDVVYAAGFLYELLAGRTAAKQATT